MLGRAGGITVSSGAGLYVLSGGVTTGTEVHSGGADIVQAGAAASGTDSSGGAEVVSSGGIAISALVANGGDQFVFSGGITSATTLLNGGLEFASPEASRAPPRSAAVAFKLCPWVRHSNLSLAMAACKLCEAQSQAAPCQ